jgi:hypothetical protein
MRMVKTVLVGSALVSAPASACPLDGAYGHRFSSLMSEYQRHAEPNAPDSWSAVQQDQQAQQSSGSTEQPAAESQADHSQGEPTYR